MSNTDISRFLAEHPKYIHYPPNNGEVKVKGCGCVEDVNYIAAGLGVKCGEFYLSACTSCNKRFLFGPIEAINNKDQ